MCMRAAVSWLSVEFVAESAGQVFPSLRAARILSIEALRHEQFEEARLTSFP